MRRYLIYFLTAIVAFSIGVFAVFNFYQKDENVVLQIQENIQTLRRDALPPAQNLSLIVPGKSVGNLELGNSKEEVLQKLGDKKSYIFHYGISEEENFPEMQIDIGDENQILDRTKVRNGIEVFVNDGKTFQIKVESFLYSTAEGITCDDSLKKVLKAYPKVKAFKLLGSSSNLTGPKDLVYLVEKDNGIAFEFYYDKKEKNRRVRFIYVFEKGDFFEPDGGLNSNYQWISLKSFVFD